MKEEDGRAFVMYVKSIPEDCLECPFCIEDTNKDYLEEEKYRCLLKGKIVTAQYGGLNIAAEDYRECPLEILPCMDEEIEEGQKCPGCQCAMCEEGGEGGGGSSTTKKRNETRITKAKNNLLKKKIGLRL